MKIILAVALGVMTVSASRAPLPAPPPAEKPMQVAQNITCFFKRETTSGMNKICYYDCLGSEAAITISSIQLCPLNIKR